VAARRRIGGGRTARHSALQRRRAKGEIMAGIKVKQIAHVCIFAHDIEVTRAFYRDVLGLDTQFNFLRDGKQFGFYLNAGGRSHVEVFQKSDSEYGPANAITHFCLEVENLDDAIAHMASKGVAIDRPKKKACDDTWQAWIRDPDGVRIELFQYTDKSAQFTGGDRVADW
jgi:lactoylglutathione lyase/glyoxylase I family protein